MRLAMALSALAVPICSIWISAADAGQLKALADKHQWFALRDSVQKMADPPALYRGAVACAFHDVKRCQQDMQAIMRHGTEEDRREASGFLMLQHALAGHFRLAAKYSEGLPASDGLHAMLSTYGNYPDLIVAAHGRSSIRYQRAAGHLLLPTLINGRPTTYILDTGANFSMITESEAKRLGLRTSALHAPDMMDSTGAGFTLGKVALADRLEVGNFRLKNVPFMVVDDDLDALAELPDGARGAIGMQVLLAFRMVQWNSAGTIELGGRAEPSNVGRANLCLDGLLPLVEGTYGAAKLTFILDTGDSESQLYPRFAREFASLVKDRGKPGTWSMSGAGGTVAAQTTMLPDFRLDVGGLTATLQPVHILAQGAGSEIQHGVIGMDVLRQASQVTIDFQAMRITLANLDGRH